MFDKDGNPIELNADTPEVKALIEASLQEFNTGLAANRDELLNEKKALKQQLDDVSKQWEGLDPAAVRTLMERLENDEEGKLLAEGKFDDVINRRTERLQADTQKQIQSFTEQLASKDSELSSAKQQVKSLLIEGNMQQAAAQLGVVPSAYEDAVYRAKSIFDVDENGKLVAEENGTTVYGKDGKSSITPAEWLESMREKAPHWFPAPSGAGSGGGGRGGTGSHTITRAEAQNPQAYQAAKAEAEKAGVTLQIVAN